MLILRLTFNRRISTKLVRLSAVLLAAPFVFPLVFLHDQGLLFSAAGAGLIALFVGLYAALLTAISRITEARFKDREIHVDSSEVVELGPSTPRRSIAWEDLRRLYVFARRPRAPSLIAFSFWKPSTQISFRFDERRSTGAAERITSAIGDLVPPAVRRGDVDRFSWENGGEGAGSLHVADPGLSPTQNAFSFASALVLPFLMSVLSASPMFLEAPELRVVSRTIYSLLAVLVLLLSFGGFKTNGVGPWKPSSTLRGLALGAGSILLALILSFSLASVAELLGWV